MCMIVIRGQDGVCGAGVLCAYSIALPRVWDKQSTTMKIHNYLLRESLIIKERRIPLMMPRAVFDASIYIGHECEERIQCRQLRRERSASEYRYPAWFLFHPRRSMR